MLVPGERSWIWRAASGPPPPGMMKSTTATADRVRFARTRGRLDSAHAGARLELRARRSRGEPQRLAHGRLHLGGGVGVAAGGGRAQLVAHNGDAGSSRVGGALGQV